jgi:hypothetical protein
VTPYASTSLRKLGIYVDGERLANYRIQDSRAGVDAGTNLGVYGQWRVGWIERRLGSVLDTGPDFFPNVTERVGGPRAAIAIDTYDQPFFPTRGVKLDVTHFDAHRVSSNVEEYSRSEARFGVAGTLGSWTVLGGLEGGYSFKGTLPLGDAFTLGGPRRLSGFATDQLLGGEYAFGRLEAQYRLTLPIPVFGLSFIGGLLAEGGRMNKRITETALSGWQSSFGAYLAASTTLGPFYIGFSDAKNGKGRFSELECGRVSPRRNWAADGRAVGVPAEVAFDDVAGATCVLVAIDPDLRQGSLDGQLAHHARGVRVEDACANAPVAEVIRKQVRFGQVGGGEDSLQSNVRTSRERLRPVRSCRAPVHHVVRETERHARGDPAANTRRER